MRRRAGIRGKIAGAILLCMIPVLVLAVVLYTSHIADRRSTVVRAQEDLARALARDVATFFADSVHTERLAGAAVTAALSAPRGREVVRGDSGDRPCVSAVVAGDARRRGGGRGSGALGIAFVRTGI
jgi:hypothetical protein